VQSCWKLKKKFKLKIQQVKALLFLKFDQRWQTKSNN
jgi:hypothetical protein